MGTLRRQQGLDAEQRPRRSNPQKLKEMQDLFWVSPQVSGAAVGRLGGYAFRRAAAEPHGGPDGVQLHDAGDRHPDGRRSEPSQHVLHHHR